MRFAFKRRVFQNDLTNLLDNNPNTSVRELLCHHELSVTVRNDAPSLKAFLSREDAETGHKMKLHTLIDWALTLKHNTEDDLKKYKIFQINRNAATVLAAPNRNINELVCNDREHYLIKALNEFTSSEILRDEYAGPIFIGHFQQVTESQMLHNMKYMREAGFLVKNVVSFCIANLDMIGCQILLSHIATEFRACLETDYKSDAFQEGHPITQYFNDILREAARQCFIITKIEEAKHDREMQNMDSSIAAVAAYRQEQMSTSQPINWRGMEIPTPYYHPRSASRYLLTKDVLDRMKKFAQRYNLTATKSECRLRKESTAQMKAYFALTSIHQAILEYPDLSEYLGNKHSLRLILFCGIYSDDTSTVSRTAFRLARYLIYGDIRSHYGLFSNREEEFERVKGFIDQEETEKMTRDVIETMANMMIFDLSVTPKMVAAFPVFWDQRYKNLARWDQEGEYDDITITLTKKRPRGIDKHHGKDPGVQVYRKPEGKTPFELYNQFLLHEQQMSDFLNHEIWSILARVDQKAKEKKEEAAAKLKWYDEQTAAIKADLPLFEFLRSRFEWRAIGKPNQIVRADMDVIHDVFPCMPPIQGHKDINITGHRVPTNGYLHEFAMYLLDCNVNILDCGLPTVFSEHRPALRDDILMVVSERNGIIKDFAGRAGLGHSNVTREEILARTGDHDLEPIDTKKFTPESALDESF